jgi:hypothetical protein
VGRGQRSETRVKEARELEKQARREAKIRRRMERLEARNAGQRGNGGMRLAEDESR